MLGVILAAGKGLRLLPFTENTPKPLVVVNGKPIIEYILEALPDSIDKIIIITGYLSEQIEDYLEYSWNDVPIEYIEQNQLNGTGTAIHLIKDYINEPFLVVNGDDLYSKEDLTRLSEHTLAMLVSETVGPAPSSINIDQTGRLAGIQTNPPAGESILRNTGAYMLDQSFFEYPLHEIQVHDKTEYSLPHTLIDLTKEKNVQVEKATFWKPIGTLDELKQAQGLDTI
jgi:UDP-N-acetylglucosamine diphosphorylase / glucose-1-phosphate thymidylyltransferase / UDP-N-acetylgalactosamine diphosphorylase / glucosamine-1-phosphate N-acetyltransferase / galactosamine-1-phosphate N-acetyltransferase